MAFPTVRHDKVVKQQIPTARFHTLPYGATFRFEDGTLPMIKVKAGAGFAKNGHYAYGIQSNTMLKLNGDEVCCPAEVTIQYEM